MAVRVDQLTNVIVPTRHCRLRMAQRWRGMAPVATVDQPISGWCAQQNLVAIKLAALDNTNARQ